MPINNISLSEIKEFYPITDSLTQDKINTLTSFVKSNTFLQMFGLALADKIFSGEILDNGTPDFIGFRKFVCLCIANQLIKDTFVHTNAGLKIVNQQNWQSPKINEKIILVNELQATVENQFLAAKKILIELNYIPKNTYAGYSSIKIDRV